MASLASERRNEPGIMELKGSFLSQQQNLATCLCLPHPLKSKASFSPKKKLFLCCLAHPPTPSRLFLHCSPRSFTSQDGPFMSPKDTCKCVQT